MILTGLNPHLVGKAPIWITKHFKPEFNKLDNENKTALVLIQGSGAVRPGIWARSVCINDCLEYGTMIKQTEWAREKGYGVLIMNPNHESNKSMEEHATLVWGDYVENSGFSNLFVIAHSAGGPCLTAIQKKYASTFYS